MNSVIVDTGPLVALINPRDQYHGWAMQCAQELSTPWLTCEAVISEAFHLLQRTPSGSIYLTEMLSRPGGIICPWIFEENRAAVLKTIRTYQQLPASFANACLLGMAAPRSLIWTTDVHFSVYRLSGGKKSLHTLSPSKK
jgi:predicted nucleic acid-binding protein